MLIEEQNGNFAKPVLGAVPFLNEIVNMGWKEAIKQVPDKSIEDNDRGGFGSTGIK